MNIEYKRSGLIKILFVIVLMVSYCQVFSQKGLTKGNAFYDRNMYTEAIENYILAIDGGDKVVQEEAKYKLANCYRLTGQFELAEDLYGQLHFSSPQNPKKLLDYGLALKSSAKYAESKEAFKKYMDLKPDDPMGVVYYESAILAQALLDEEETNIVKNVKIINSEEAEFSPTYYRNGIVFTSSMDGGTKKMVSFDGGNQVNNLDFWFLDLSVPTQMMQHTLFTQGINTAGNEGTITFTADGKKCYFTLAISGERRKGSNIVLKTLQVFESSQNLDGTWTDPKSAFKFNSPDYSIAHPSISGDGLFIYFISDMPNGFGGTDIYMCVDDGFGGWSDPINLGETINTFGHELFPFIHGNNTLYFSSDGHPGMGNLDVFVSENIEDEWSEPENLKRPINSIGDDFGYSRDPVYRRGFFSSDRFGGIGADDIYSYIEKGINLRTVGEGEFELVDHSFFDGISYQLIKNDTSKEKTKLAAYDGKFTFKLEPQVSYTLKVRKDRFSYTKIHLSYTTNTKDKWLELNVTSTKQPIRFDGFLADYFEDEDGKSVKNAFVVARENTLQHGVSRTNDKGYFSFPEDLKVKKTYTIEASKSINEFFKNSLTIQGRVTYLDKPRPAGGKEVSMWYNNKEEIKRLTNRGGKYKLNITSNKIYELKVNVENYFEACIPINTTGKKALSELVQDIQLVPLVWMDEAEERMKQRAIQDSIKRNTPVECNGYVICDDDSIGGAVLQIFNEDDSLIAETTTNDKGFYSLELGQGVDYFINANKENYSTAMSAIFVPIVDSFEPIQTDIEMSLVDKLIIGGQVNFKDKPLANTEVVLSDENQVIDRQKTDKKGQYGFEVNAESKYSVTATGAGFFQKDIPVNTAGMYAGDRVDVNMNLDKLEVDKTIQIEDIYYDYRSSDIRPESYLELQKLINFLNINPTVAIELRSHTDSRGGDQYNLNLSQKRAEEVSEYLIIFGINKERVNPKGYGEFQPLIPNAQSEEEHQLNRRTEFRVLKL